MNQSLAHTVQELVTNNNLTKAGALETKASAKASEFDRIIAKERKKLREMHLTKHEDELQAELVQAQQRAEKMKADAKKAQEEYEKAKKQKTAADQKREAFKK